MRSLLIACIVVVSLMAGALIVIQMRAGVTDNETQLTEPIDLAEGRLLYTSYCASCHGADLEGEPNWQSPNPDGSLPAPPHDKTGHTWHHGDQLLFDYTKFGGAVALRDSGVRGFNSAMPGFGDVLSDGQIRNILEYIKSTWPSELRDVQDTHSEVERSTKE